MSSRRAWLLLVGIFVTSFTVFKMTISTSTANVNQRQFNPPLNEYEYNSGDYENLNDLNMNNTSNAHEEPRHASDSSKKCRPMTWHSSHHPSCNILHELDMHENYQQLVASGSFRDVWKVLGDNMDKLAVKTLRFSQSFNTKNFDLHRIDAVSLERASSNSPYITDVYGHCVNSLITEFTDMGDLTRLHIDNRDFSKRDLLEIALQISRSIATIHALGIVHADIKPNQFLFIDGKYKLNDFNRAEFTKYNGETNATCPFAKKNNWGAWRSPEEYLDKPLTSAIDVYSLGHVLHFVLANKVPFYNMTIDEAVEYVKRGGREYYQVSNESDVYETTIAQVLDACFEFDPDKRATAQEIVAMLQRALDEIDNEDND